MLTGHALYLFDPGSLDLMVRLALIVTLPTGVELEADRTLETATG